MSCAIAFGTRDLWVRIKQVGFGPKMCMDTDARLSEIDCRAIFKIQQFTYPAI
jgi:hypothetical protein